MKTPHKVKINVYRVQIRFSPLGDFHTYATTRSKVKAMAQVQELAGPSVQARVMHGNEQLCCEGGR